MRYIAFLLCLVTACTPAVTPVVDKVSPSSLPPSFPENPTAYKQCDDVFEQRIPRQTSEVIKKADENARNTCYRKVAYYLGDIEFCDTLPASGSIQEGGRPFCYMQAAVTRNDPDICFGDGFLFEDARQSESAVQGIVEANRAVCIIFLASKNRNVDYCAKIPSDAEPYTEGYQRKCVFQYAKANNDTSVCSRIPDDLGRQNCEQFKVVGIV